MNRLTVMECMQICLLVCLWCTVDVLCRPPPSPCANVFAYEGDFEEDRWYGVISFTANIELAGVDIKLALDNPAHILVSWEGEARTTDNTRFNIFNPFSVVKAGDTMKLRIMVKFSPSNNIPVIHAIVINGNTVCSGGSVVMANAVGLDSNGGPSLSRTTTERYDPSFNNNVEDIAAEFENNQGIRQPTAETNDDTFSSSSSGTSNKRKNGNSNNSNNNNNNNNNNRKPIWPDTDANTNTNTNTNNDDWPSKGGSVSSNSNTDRQPSSEQSSWQSGSTSSAKNKPQQPSVSDQSFQSVGSRPQVPSSNIGGGYSTVNQQPAQGSSFSSTSNTGGNQQPSQSSSFPSSSNSGNQPSTSANPDRSNTQLSWPTNSNNNNNNNNNNRPQGSSSNSLSNSGGQIPQNGPIVTTLTIPNQSNSHVDKILEAIKNQLELQSGNGNGNNTFIVAVVPAGPTITTTASATSSSTTTAAAARTTKTQSQNQNPNTTRPQPAKRT